MPTDSWIQTLGFVSSIALPFFNIPLMMRLIRRRSSQDLSLTWVIGVFLSLLGMFPAGLRSTDLIFRVFTVVNLAFFSGVTALAIYFRYSSAKSK